MRRLRLEFLSIIGTSLVLLAGICCTLAGEIKIVSPSAYKDTEGEGAVGGCGCPPYRYQQVFPAEDFAALNEKPHWLVDITIRPDQSLRRPLTLHFPDNENRLSTTQRGPDNLSSRFDDNFGTDLMTFYRGPITMVADVDGPGAGPREFYNADFTAGVIPYLYDPSKGNLLFDVIARQGVSPSLSEDKIPGMQTGLFGSSPFARQGGRSAAGIYQFTFVPMLAAGDADQDLDFDQLDLVQVQIGAKYLTGQAATWGDGDWNGAPGGRPGNPPTGDGFFNQRDIIAALGTNTYLTGPYAAIQQGGTAQDGQASILYNAQTGELAVDAPSGTDLTSVNIESAAGIFTGDPAQNLGGSFDNDAANNIFKATFGSSFGSLSFGNVAQPGLGEDFLLGDLSVVGSLAGGGSLGAADLIYVPEPSSVVLLSLGILAVAACRRMKKLSCPSASI